MATPKGRKNQSSRVEDRKVIQSFQTLAEQPLSLSGIPHSQWDKVIVSAIVDPDTREEEIICRASDPIWTLISTTGGRKGEAAHRTKFNWDRIQIGFRATCQSILYRHMKTGLANNVLPKPSTLRIELNQMAVFTRYLHAHGVRSLADVHPIHISNFVQEEKARGLDNRTLSSRFDTIELLYHFRAEHEDGLRIHPWQGSTSAELAGRRKDGTGQDGKTPLIPWDISQKLFNFSMKVLETANRLLDERDAGLRSKSKDKEVNRIMRACFYLLGVLTGMRLSELAGIELNAARTEIIDGVPLHWLKTESIKGNLGVVEYLMPELGWKILQVMERFSAPARTYILAQLTVLRTDKSKEGKAGRLLKIRQLSNMKNCIFLSLGGSQVFAGISEDWGSKEMKKFAEDAGVDWELSAHQLRRLYAYTFVRHRLGNVLFLREQLKHASMNLTLLYCSNPLQDDSLYYEIMEEMNLQKAERVLKWIEPGAKLSGGLGNKIARLPAHSFKSRMEMVTEVSSKLTIRANATAWCLAEDGGGCAGHCMWEQTNCSGKNGGCGTSVIDEDNIPVWKEIYRQTKELLPLIPELGKGAAAKVKRDFKRSVEVLRDLGVALDTEDSDDESSTG